MESFRICENVNSLKVHGIKLFLIQAKKYISHGIVWLFYGPTAFPSYSKYFCSTILRTYWNIGPTTAVDRIYILFGKSDLCRSCRSCQCVVDIATIRIAFSVAHKFVGRMHILLSVGCTLFVGRRHTFCRSETQLFLVRCTTFGGRMNNFCRLDAHICRSAMNTFF